MKIILIITLVETGQIEEFDMAGITWNYVVRDMFTFPAFGKWYIKVME